MSTETNRKSRGDLARAEEPFGERSSRTTSRDDSVQNSEQGGVNQSTEDAVSLLDILRERIARHDLPPGVKLREAELSEEFGVSRARVREILGALEQRGLIERIPNRGAVVVRLALKEALDLFNVREMLEALAIRLATERAPPGTWEKLLDRFHDPSLQTELEEGRFHTYIQLLEKLRDLMIMYADNDLLREMLENIHDKSRFVARRVIILPNRWQMALKNHQAMVQAMSEGNAGEAERIKREIISTAREALKRYQDFIF